MSTMSLDKQINQYLPLLANEEKKSILRVILSFIKLKETLPKRISIEQYNRELDEAEAEMNAGNFISQEDAKKQAESWF